MTQFYVADRSDVERCRQSLHRQATITITGRKANGSLVELTGVVQAVEERLDASGRRWRITIRDAPTN
jgi:hypothetical protein